jgi:hypothetical protein
MIAAFSGMQRLLMTSVASSSFPAVCDLLQNQYCGLLIPFCISQQSFHYGNKYLVADPTPLSAAPRITIFPFSLVMFPSQFEVTILNTASIIPTIQKRVTIFDHSNPAFDNDGAG